MNVLFMVMAGVSNKLFGSAECHFLTQKAQQEEGTKGISVERKLTYPTQ